MVPEQSDTMRKLIGRMNHEASEPLTLERGPKGNKEVEQDALWTEEQARC